MADDTKMIPDAPAFRSKQAEAPVVERAAYSLSGTEAKIKAMITALHQELAKVEGEASEFLLNARKHVANVAIHANAHFDWLRGVAADAESKAKAAVELKG